MPAPPDAGDFGPWLAAWLAGAAVVGLVHWRRNMTGVGIVLAYLLHLWLIHWVGAAVYLAPGPHLHDGAVVLDGFRQSVAGVLAFAVGSVLVAPMLAARRDDTDRKLRFPARPGVAGAYLVLGAVAYVLSFTFLSATPTVSALAAAAQRLFVLGLCLVAWRAWRARRTSVVVISLLVAMTFPYLTVIFQGFIGYGTAALITVLLFVASFFRPRSVSIAVGMVACYLGLSVFVSYAQNRSDIRDVVWGGRPLSERAERVYDLTLGLELFNPSSPIHRDALDDRLNQNHLVGASVRYLSLTGELARGQTVVDAIVALVPRALWADKPLEAGSGDLVTRYTGIRFAQGTSVGIGHVLELYVNYGSAGVLVGFLALGTVVTLIDAAAARRLRGGDEQGFALLFLVGISFANVGGSFVELTTSAGASALLAVGINQVYLHRKRASLVPAGPVPATS